MDNELILSTITATCPEHFKVKDIPLHTNKIQKYIGDFLKCALETQSIFPTNKEQCIHVYKKFKFGQIRNHGCFQEEKIAT